MPSGKGEQVPVRASAATAKWRKVSRRQGAGSLGLGAQPRWVISLAETPLLPLVRMTQYPPLLFVLVAVAAVQPLCPRCLHRRAGKWPDWNLFWFKSKLTPSAY